MQLKALDQATDARLSDGFSALSKELRRPMLLGAIVLMLFGYGFHLLAVREVPLFLAQTGIAMSLVVTALLAVRYFGDHLSRREWGAVAA